MVGADDARPHVLVVDDTASIRFLVRANLELEGWHVSEAEDGQECLDLLASGDGRPDVVTIDVVMPRLDGLDTVSAIRSDPATRDLPVVMLTTQAQAVDLQRGKDVGVDAYVTKPFDPDFLVATIRRVLGITGA